MNLKENEGLVKKAKTRVAGDTKLVIILSIVVFIVCASRIPERTEICVFPDEFAQFAIAAYFAGHDWSDVVSQDAFYYSYGYAILLIPFFVLLKNPDMIYTSALILNTILVSCTVPLSYALCKRWGASGLRDNPVLIPVILLSSLSGAAVAYSVLGWAEAALIVSAFAITLCFYKLQENGCSGYWFVIQAFLLVYGYALHQRFLGVLIAGSFVLLIMTIMKKVKIKHFTLFFSAIVVLFAAHSIIKNDIQTNLWLIGYQGDALLNNDYGSVFNKATNILTTAEGFLSAARVFAGQLFYLGVASFLLIYFSVHRLLGLNIEFLKDTFGNIRGQKREFDFSLMFMLLAFLFTFAISVVFMHLPNRGDHLVFGRYNAIIYSVLCLYIMSMIIKGEYRPGKAAFIVAGAFIALTFLTSHFFHTLYSTAHYVNVNTINLTAFRMIYGDAAFILAGLVSTVAGLLMAMSRGIKLSAVATMLVYAFCVCVSVLNASIVVSGYKNYNVEIVTDAAAVMKKIENDGLPVYFLSNGYNDISDSRVGRSLLQFNLFDEKLHILHEGEDAPSGDFYLMLPGPSIFSQVNDGYSVELIYPEDAFSLYKYNCVFQLYRVGRDNTYQLKPADDITTLNMTNEFAFLISNANWFERGFMWTGDGAAFFFRFDGGEDYFFRLNLAQGIPEGAGSLGIRFMLGADEETGEVVYKTTVDSSTKTVEFMVPGGKFEGRNHILRLAADTWKPSEVLGTPGYTRDYGIPISSIEAIPAGEYQSGAGALR